MSDQIWTPAQLRPWSGLVVKAPVLRNLIQVDSIDNWFSTDRKMGNYTHWPLDCSDSGDNDDNN